MTQRTPVGESSYHSGLAVDLPLVKESITSRVLVRNRLLELNEFTMDKGQQLSEHTSTRAVVVGVVEGKLLFTLNGEERELSNGDLVYMAPNAPHALTALEATRFTLTMVKVDEIPAEIVNG